MKQSAGITIRKQITANNTHFNKVKVKRKILNWILKKAKSHIKYKYNAI
jgi:hypothetical protein